MTNPGPQGATMELPAGDMRADAPRHHVAVCICTMKRPQLLSRTLAGLEKQETGGRFTYSIVVADNDALASAQQVVRDFRSRAVVSVVYCIEPQPNIALARNMALQNAEGDLVAFIDDDEFPVEDWLRRLVDTYDASGADGVLGPVEPYFETEPPQWVRKGRFFDRPVHATGYQLGWEQSRTGNVLFRKSILNDLEVAFRATFATAGEDMDFFRRAIDLGCRFVWCQEAVAHEVVPPSRCTRMYLLRRALLRGSNFPKHPENRIKNLAKSLIALPCYTLILPILYLFGQHIFLKYLIKVLDHASRLVAFLGFSLVTQRQT